MSQTYYLRHHSGYQYEFPVSRSLQLCRLIPADLPHQSCISHQLHLNVAPSQRLLQRDAFGNQVERILIEKPYQQLDFIAESQILCQQPLWPDQSPSVAEVLQQLRQHCDPQVQAMRCPSPLIPRHPELANLARPHFAGDRPWLDAMRDFNHWLFTHLEFDPSATTVHTPVFEVARHRRGVCQDFSHLMLACLRSLGFAARYLSGYLLTHPPEGCERLQGADASHAWVEAYCPDLGWFPFDPTNNLMPKNEHVILAHGRDFSDVSPIRGVLLGGGKHQIDVSVTLSTTPLASEN
jgi:transglutaminase-like putative cysteine protease